MHLLEIVFPDSESLANPSQAIFSRTFFVRRLLKVEGYRYLNLASEYGVQLRNNLNESVALSVSSSVSGYFAMVFYNSV